MNYNNNKKHNNDEKISFDSFSKMVLNDYKLARISRETSILGRKEVLNGRAKFGIFGDGKEIPQLAMAKVFRNGDFRSGYYRDQTFMMAIGALTVRSFFSQLYAHSDLEAEPVSSGRMMTAHFGTRFLNHDGTWKNLIHKKNSSADISSTAAQMPRLLGLAQASKIYKKLKNLKETHKMFSHNGNEVAFGTIGNASISEGLFWETLNAASVLQIPMILSIWDDEYGISVPNKYQFSKQNISDLLSGFHRNKKEKGIEILSVNGSDYMNLTKTYVRANQIARYEHVPVIIHVTHLTQPQGHSTSSSHERYKSKERLKWELNNDGIKKFRNWILNFKFNTTNQFQNLANVCYLDQIDIEAKEYVKNEQKKAWEAFQKPILKIKNEAVNILQRMQSTYPNSNKKWINEYVKKYIQELHDTTKNFITKKSIFRITRKILYLLSEVKSDSKYYLIEWIKKKYDQEQENYSSHLYSISDKSSVNITEVFPVYNNNNFEVDGRIVLRENFDKLLELYPDLLIFGEDVGKIGDVNQGLEGLQKKYGKTRIFDTGIRESTILGQGIGLAMRGLRPIVEIQYLDYILYALQIMSDDLACLQYRTKGGQKAPVIIRTRGHRLEGIWHSGSPMGGIINYLRGILVLVPRNMVKAAGFYNTLLSGDDPALVIECLNGYRIKEKLPENLGFFRTPIGIVERTRKGKDITIVTYGSTWRIVNEASEELSKINIDSEVIDIQSLLPFDLQKDIVKSLQKTNRLLIIDEDVPGGASAYILQKILEEQNGYYYLDSPPVTITAKEHRPPYGSDGDYFSKPSVENIVEEVLKIMHDS
ncbi:bifunctional transketolase/2-oxoacid (pyruvate/branched-chain alpha-keto acid) dehydrogenase E1 component [Blattabacterium sp. (Blattella germanica) str. Bge]|uniref:alpha-ketoacid dehydrogenase subunit alpha/beta n=1 Tax=Blattabacterium sp. (Blattella germanica) TaxID=624186 RepID=UPI0001BB6203|nr:thiamine pyrophosphate-dependent enzyme [Blattabacterium sp. (Blattella germanica)]ACY40461.1 bifunctional transketolase/2-oxoacid (pyruvate/branched-chain alpha-keto acid) dehydrogenase E1 component [Blattabacterium sp. (Blattella germanica) str. Bge]